MVDFVAVAAAATPAAGCREPVASGGKGFSAIEEDFSGTEKSSLDAVNPAGAVEKPFLVAEKNFSATEKPFALVKEAFPATATGFA